jgi:hypothetical protein
MLNSLVMLAVLSVTDSLVTPAVLSVTGSLVMFVALLMLTTTYSTLAYWTLDLLIMLVKLA